MGTAQVGQALFPAYGVGGLTQRSVYEAGMGRMSTKETSVVPICVLRAEVWSASHWSGVLLSGPTADNAQRTARRSEHRFTMRVHNAFGQVAKHTQQQKTMQVHNAGLERRVATTRVVGYENAVAKPLRCSVVDQCVVDRHVNVEMREDDLFASPPGFPFQH